MTEQKLLHLPNLPPDSLYLPPKGPVLHNRCKGAVIQARSTFYCARCNRKFGKQSRILLQDWLDLGRAELRPAVHQGFGRVRALISKRDAALMAKPKGIKRTVVKVPQLVVSPVERSYYPPVSFPFTEEVVRNFNGEVWRELSADITPHDFLRQYGEEERLRLVRSNPGLEDEHVLPKGFFIRVK